MRFGGSPVRCPCPVWLQRATIRTKLGVRNMVHRLHLGNAPNNNVGATAPRPELFLGRDRIRLACVWQPNHGKVPQHFRGNDLRSCAHRRSVVSCRRAENIAACAALSPTTKPFVGRTMHGSASTRNQFSPHHQVTDLPIMVDASLRFRSTSGKPVSSCGIAQTTSRQAEHNLKASCESSLRACAEGGLQQRKTNTDAKNSARYMFAECTRTCCHT